MLSRQVKRLGVYSNATSTPENVRSTKLGELLNQELSINLKAVCVLAPKAPL